MCSLQYKWNIVHVLQHDFAIFHVVTIGIDALISLVQEKINTVLEEHGIKQLEAPLHLYNNSLQNSFLNKYHLNNVFMCLFIHETMWLMSASVSMLTENEEQEECW